MQNIAGMITPLDSNPIFDLAANLVNQTNRHIFLTGKAGTGKTTFLKYIKEHSPKKSVIVAPTGIAAINCGGVTIHSFFQLPFGPFIPVPQRVDNDSAELSDAYTLLQNLRIHNEKRELFEEIELLIIDEISMVRCDVLDAIDVVLRHVRKKRGTNDLYR
jgi:Cdc6-like AAA superfamily ATPase